MHIGVLTTSYPHERDAVSGSFVRSMNRALAARGHALTVLCARHFGVGDPLEDPRVTVRSVPYAPPVEGMRIFGGAGAPDALRGKSPAALVAAASVFPALGLEAIRLLRGCDALVSHFVLPCGVVGASLRLAGLARAHLAVAHGTDAHWFARVPSALQRGVAEGCDGIWVTHEGARGAWDASVRASERVRVAPMGFDPARPLSNEQRALVRARYGVQRDELLAVCIARCVPVKGLDVLVRATEAPAFSHAVRVLVAGDGPTREPLEREARAKGLPVQFVGAVDAATRDELLRAADLFVLPSRAASGMREGAPVALLEALGAGLPCVVTDAGAMPALAEDAALVVPPDDPRALGEAITVLAAHPSLRVRLGFAARKPSSPHSWEQRGAWVERWLRELSD